MARTNTNTGGGGGGGPVTGLTGTATQFVYLDVSGNGTGDALATRNSITNLTNIAKAFSADLTQGFQITDSLLGALDFTGNYATDTAAVTSAFVGVTDLTPFGQPTTVAIIGAQNSAGDFQNVIVSPLGVNASFSQGTTDVALTMNATQFRAQFNNGTGVDGDFRMTATETYIGYDDNTNDWEMGADATGFFFEKNGSKFRMPSAIVPVSVDQVIVSGVGGTSSWIDVSTLVAPGGSDMDILFNMNGVSDGDGYLTYDYTNGVFNIANNTGSGNLFSVKSTTNLITIGDSASNFYFDSSLPGFFYRFFGNRDIDLSGVTYTPIGAPGLNDITFTGTWNGAISPSTFSAVIDAVDCAIFVTDTPGAPGVSQGDTIEAYVGGPGGTLLATGTVVSQAQGYPTSGAVIIDFGGVDISTADTIVDTTSTTTNTGSFLAQTDTVTYTETNSGGSSTLQGYPILTYAIVGFDGISVIGAAATGHTLGDQWSEDYTISFSEMVKFDGLNNRITNSISSDNGKLASIYLGDNTGGGITGGTTSQFAVDQITGTMRSSLRLDTNTGFVASFNDSSGTVVNTLTVSGTSEINIALSDTSTGETAGHFATNSAGTFSADFGWTDGAVASSNFIAASNVASIATTDGTDLSKITLNPTLTTITTPGLLVEATTGGNQWFNISPGSGLVQMGDLSGSIGGTKSFIDATAETITEITDGLYTVENVLGNGFLGIDIANDTYWIGDKEAVAQGNYLEINNATQRWGSYLSAGALWSLIVGVQPIFQVDVGGGTTNIGTGMIYSSITDVNYGSTTSISASTNQLSIGVAGGTGATTANLPTSPTVGLEITVSDAGGSSSGNNITVDAGTGKVIRTQASPTGTQTDTIVTDGQVKTYKYISTNIWQLISTN